LIHSHQQAHVLRIQLTILSKPPLVLEHPDKNLVKELLQVIAEISDDEVENNDELNTLGYRLIDTSILSSTLSNIHRCEEGMEYILFYFLCIYIIKLGI
jgi:hypothetical protein